MSQRDRVLAALRRYRETGITQIDFDAPNVIDGGKPIKRVAARVEELRNRDGFQIDSSQWRHGCSVYKLTTSCRTGADMASATAPAPDGDTMTAGSPPSRPAPKNPTLEDFETLADSLFTPAKPRNAIYGNEAA